MLDWNDLRYLIAVAREGSTLAAAKTLGVNQTTVARRIDALEQALGVTLFERRPDGYALTGHGERLLPLATAVEAQIEDVTAMAAALRRQISGTVRVTTTEMLAIEVLAPLISELRETHPGLHIELLADDHKLDPTRGETDVAIRVGPKPEDRGLVRKKLGESAWALFCSRAYAARHGVPKSLAELNAHGIVAGSGKMVHMGMLARLHELAPEADIAVRCNSVPNLIASVKSGVGIGPLPMLAAIDDSDLVRCLPEAFDEASEIWLLYPEQQRNSPHLRTFLDAVIARFEVVRDRISGRAPHLYAN